MFKTFKRGVAAAALVATGALGAAAPAMASSPAESANANFTSGPFHVVFNASRAANAPADSASGSFVAHAAIGGLTLAELQGPVTCLDVRGVHLGLFYPVAKSNPPELASTIRGVYIYVTDNKAGKAESVNFFPTTASSAKTCPPLPGIAPITSGFATFSG